MLSVCVFVVPREVHAALKEPPDIVLTLRKQITSDIQPPVSWGKALDDPLLNQPPVLSHILTPSSWNSEWFFKIKLIWSNTVLVYCSLPSHCKAMKLHLKWHIYQEKDVQFNAALCGIKALEQKLQLQK